MTERKKLDLGPAAEFEFVRPESNTLMKIHYAVVNTKELGSELDECVCFLAQDLQCKSCFAIWVDEYGCADGVPYIQNVPETRVAYINFYPTPDKAPTCHFATRADADVGATPRRIACVRVEYKKEQFDK